MARDESTSIHQQKIIPDGFSKIIFHYGDPYRISLNNEWQLQTDILFAGQISQHFFLENTGASDIIGINLRPKAFTRLYELPMSPFSHSVVDISIAIPTLKKLYIDVNKSKTDEEKVSAFDTYFNQLLVQHPIDEGN